MAAMIGSQTPEIVHDDSALEPVQRSLAVQLLDRLARLVQLDVADGPDLSAGEQRATAHPGGRRDDRDADDPRGRAQRQRPPPGGATPEQPRRPLRTARCPVVNSDRGLRAALTRARREYEGCALAQPPSACYDRRSAREDPGRVDG